MRISDWSSDVCSSDLGRPPGRAARADDRGRGRAAGAVRRRLRPRLAGLATCGDDNRRSAMAHQPTGGGSAPRPPSGPCMNRELLYLLLIFGLLVIPRALPPFKIPAPPTCLVFSTGPTLAWGVTTHDPRGDRT